MRGRNRSHVKARLRDVAAWLYRDEKVSVSYVLNTQPQHPALFFLGEAEGDNEPDDLGGRLFTDRYTVKARIEVHGKRTVEEAEAEVERLLAIFEDGIGTTNHLRHPEVPWDNDPATGKPYFEGVQTPYIGAVNGPNCTIPDQGTAAYAWLEAEVVCRSNIQRSN